MDAGEPTELPEGKGHDQLVDGIDDRDDLDEEDRAALHAELEASIAEADAGQTEDFATVLAELQHRP